MISISTTTAIQQRLTVNLIVILILALPEEGPRITGGRPRYQIGDTVRVNCSSGRSKPAALLNWYINGEPADQSLLRTYDTVITGREGLETSILGLEFRVKARHFRRGDMKLKVCSLKPIWLLLTYYAIKQSTLLQNIDLNFCFFFHLNSIA